LELSFADKRTAIYEQARAYFADPDHTDEEWVAIRRKKDKFNLNVIASGMKPTVSFITDESLRQQAKKTAAPSKKERGRNSLTK
jgi:hypothetical protein